MKIPLLIKIKSRIAGCNVAMEVFYNKYQISRQGFYKSVNRQIETNKMMEEIQDKVKQYRLHKDRRAGSRTLYYNLNIKVLYGIGVTKFEGLLSTHGMSLQPLRIRVVTTNSCTQSWNYGNLCNGLIINGINQLVVGDLTYISLGIYRYYLFSLTDVFSFRIVGYCLSKRMRKQEAIQALKMFIKLRGKTKLESCIHHTDGGSQYFSKNYLKALGKIQVSVAKNCLENGLAEQKNGYIKNHLIPTVKLNNPDKLNQEINRMIKFYNHERKQAKLDWKTPVEFERGIKNSKHKLYVRMHDFEKNIPTKAQRF